MTTSEVSALIALAQSSDDLQQTYEREEKALQACKTTADWEACFDAFGERTIGTYVCDWADETEYGADEQSGLAALEIGDGNTILAEWDSQGFYSVSFVTDQEAVNALADYATENRVEDEDGEE